MRVLTINRYRDVLSDIYRMATNPNGKFTKSDYVKVCSDNEVSVVIPTHLKTLGHLVYDENGYLIWNKNKIVVDNYNEVIQGIASLSCDANKKHKEIARQKKRAQNQQNTMKSAQSKFEEVVESFLAINDTKKIDYDPTKYPDQFHIDALKARGYKISKQTWTDL